MKKIAIKLFIVLTMFAQIGLGEEEYWGEVITDTTAFWSTVEFVAGNEKFCEERYSEYLENGMLDDTFKEMLNSYDGWSDELLAVDEERLAKVKAVRKRLAACEGN